MNYLLGNIMKDVSVSEIQYEVSKDMDSRIRFTERMGNGMKKTKQVMALLLALVMVVSMMPSNVQFVAATAAEDKIELGDETWSADGQAYTVF